MRELGLGVSNKDFDLFGDYAPNKLSGKILLKVEGNGEAYYVNPVDLKMHYLGRPADAFALMRELGLGITNENLNKIDECLDKVELETYQNNEYSYSLQYPQNFTLTQGDNLKYPIGSFLKAHNSGAGDWSAPVDISLSINPYLGTNLSEAWVAISYDKDIAYLAGCEEANQNSRKIELNEKENIKGLTWNKGKTSSAALGTYIYSDIYHIFKNGFCYEVSLNIAISNISNYDPSSEIEEINEDEVRSELKNVLYTFEFLE
jgi:hypothetical protein